MSNRGERMDMESITTAGAQNRIYAWAFRFLRNHHDALDATQEVMLRWMRNGARVAHRRAWLQTTTVNHCIDMLRRRRPASPIESNDLGTNASVTDSIAQRELQSAVARGLDRLSDQQRHILVAKTYDGLTFAAIANELDVSISTVKTHYVRALQQMRPMLTPYSEQTR